MRKGRGKIVVISTLTTRAATAAAKTTTTVHSTYLFLNNYICKG
jgi:hypothetical protein